MNSSVCHATSKRGGDRAVRRERVYDYLYDPVYTVSSEADHARSRLKAYASKDRVTIKPEFESMFSNLAHHPRYTLRLDSADPVPASVDRRWRGSMDQCKVARQQLAGVHPNAQSWLRREACHVTGADRWKYSLRPLIPYEQQLPPDAILDLPRGDCAPTAGEPPSHVTVGVQTDYRDSEAQTDPYSPEYTVLAWETPSELLQLTSFTWGRGLPAGQAEVDLIWRARAKRAWERTLPPLNDLSRLDKRRRMMEEMEAKEWAFREGQIQKIQEVRLAAQKDLLRRRDAAQEEATDRRLKQINAQCLKDMERKKVQIYKDYTRSLRKLEAERRNVEAGLERPGLVRRHTDSMAFAVWTQSTTDRNTRGDELTSRYLDTYEGLLKLEEGLGDLVPEPRGTDPQPAVPVIKPPESRAQKLRKKYKVLMQEMNERRAEKRLRCLLRRAKSLPRPVSPWVARPPEGEEETELAVIQLQKLLRGRSIQYEMLRGKENHLDLIRELRSVHALQGEEQELQKADEALVMNLKEQRDKQRHETARVEAYLAGAVGATLESLFDTLSKELIRLQEERRIHAFMLLAERDRRLREAEEAGKRQEEERRRLEEDEIFRQVVVINRETVDLYLEDTILKTVEHTSDQQAREEIHRRAEKVNDIAYAMEERRNTFQSEEIVSALVYSFLIPEVERISVRKKVHREQQRHLLAARSIIQEAAEVRPVPGTEPGSPVEQSSTRTPPEEDQVFD